MKSRNDLINKLDSKIATIALKAKQVEECVHQICTQTNYPESLISDFITGRVSLMDANDYVLFSIAKNLLTETQLAEYYNKSQIKNYSAYKYKPEKLNKITFPMVQIAEDQWLGYVDVKQLIQLRDNQIIQYNENTQRTLHRVVNGEEEYYKIYVNKKQVKAIVESYQNGQYIPNTITLNVLRDENGDSADINYNETTKELTLSNIKSIDIIDGYHRYLAISYLKNIDPEFQYSMELRIVNFTEARAKQFIWQEDQKTRMDKIDVAGFNQAKDSNKIVNRLIKDLNGEGSVFYGKISRNKAIINETFLSQAIDEIYVKDIPANQRDIAVIKISKELREKLETLVINEPKLLTERWSPDYIIAVVYWCKYGNNKKILPYINKLADNGPLYKNNRKDKVIVDFKKIDSIIGRR